MLRIFIIGCAKCLLVVNVAKVYNFFRKNWFWCQLGILHATISNIYLSTMNLLNVYTILQKFQVAMIYFA